MRFGLTRVRVGLQIRHAGAGARVVLPARPIAVVAVVVAVVVVFRDPEWPWDAAFPGEVEGDQGAEGGERGGDGQPRAAERPMAQTIQMPGAVVRPRIIGELVTITPSARASGR